jgi:hypothetical protein
MSTSNQIDVRSLLKEAQSSEHKESFRVLEKTKDYRIGVGVRISTKSPSFFLEVIIYQHSTKEHLTVSDITQQLPLLKKLQERGYLVSCQDEVCSVLEMTIPRDSLLVELAYLKTSICKTFQHSFSYLYNHK